MYKRKPRIKPQPDYDRIPKTIEDFGLFLNDKDQLRLVTDPESNNPYNVTSSERYNDLRWSYYQLLLGDLAVERHLKLGLQLGRLPLDATDDQPHTPILHSADLYTNTDKILLIFSDGAEVSLGTSCLFKDWRVAL